MTGGQGPARNRDRKLPCHDRHRATFWPVPDLGHSRNQVLSTRAAAASAGGWPVSTKTADSRDHRIGFRGSGNAHIPHCQAASIVLVKSVLRTRCSGNIPLRRHIEKTAGPARGTQGRFRAVVMRAKQVRHVPIRDPVSLRKTEIACHDFPLAQQKTQQRLRCHEGSRRYNTTPGRDQAGIAGYPPPLAVSSVLWAGLQHIVQPLAQSGAILDCVLTGT